MNYSPEAQARLDGWQKRAIACAVLGVVLALVFGWIDANRAGSDGWQHFFQSYIFGYMYWAVFSFGALGFLMLHHLTGGPWGIPVRRLFEAGTRTLPLMAALFLPVLLGVSRLYPWAQPDKVAEDPLLQYKHPYLNPGFFTVRAVIYFAILCGFAFVLNRLSLQQDRTGDASLAHRMSVWSGPGMVIWGFTVSLCVIDWVMTLEPHWFSTMYGFIFLVSSGQAAMCASVIVLRLLGDTEPLRDEIQAKRLNDLGNLMLAMVMLWTYMSFSQFLIIWAGNMKDEIPWYQVRAFGPWASIAAILLVFHFAVPFLFLLQRRVKRGIGSLSRVAALLLVLTVIDIYWLVVPAYEQTGPQFRLLDLFALAGIGGLWVAVFIWQLKKMPLVALHDSRFPAVLEQEHGD